MRETSAGRSNANTSFEKAIAGTLPLRWRTRTRFHCHYTRARVTAQCVSRSLVTQLLADARELARSYTHPVSKRRVLGTDGFQLLLIQRLRASARSARVPLVNHLLRRFSTAVYGTEIGNEVTLGDGVNFIHPMAVVIGGDAKVGARVRFMGSNTVGTAKDNGYPVIEDDVMVGAGARILGPVRIGAGAIIGANAVVLHDVPAGAVVTGVPGVVRERSTHD
ncbi:MAG: serine acetyltransferase [Archangium sp.]|nr:serine acetyltransferase [Archangium sp.]